MNKKKGFTLIELLAIIVILAIIAVITVPIILGIIDNAKKGSVINSAYGYKDAINKWYVSKLQTDRGATLNGTYSVSDGYLDGQEIPLSGDKPSSGYLSYSNNVLTDGCLTIGDYKITFENGEVKSSEKGVCEGSITYSIEIISGTKGDLKSGDVVRIGDTEDFYVVSSDNSAGGKTVLLAKYNLNVGYDVTVVDNSPFPPNQQKTAIPTPEEIKQDSNFGGYDGTSDSFKAIDFLSGSYWMDRTTDPFTLKFDYSNNGKYRYDYDGSSYKFLDENDVQVFPYVYDSNSLIYQYVNGENGYVDFLIDNGAPTSIVGRLLTYEEALLSGCVAYGSSPCTGWISETSFYTGSADSTTNVWEISGTSSKIIRPAGMLLPNGIAAGVRPVIEIPTSDIY